MAETDVLTPIDVPLTVVAPAKLVKQASAESCGLFFPYGTHLPMGLAVDWDGETHLIHLDGPHVYKEGGIDIGHPIHGALISQISFRVDVTSRYNSGHSYDPAGALVLKGGAAFLYCSRLGDQFHYDPRPVPVGTSLMPSVTDEACGFKKWSVTVLDHGRPKLVRSFEALPAK